MRNPVSNVPIGCTVDVACDALRIDLVECEAAFDAAVVDDKPTVERKALCPWLRGQHFAAEFGRTVLPRFGLDGLVQGRADAQTDVRRVDGDTNPEPSLGCGHVGHFEESERGKLPRCNFSDEFPVKAIPAAACGGGDLGPAAWPVGMHR